MTADVRRRMSVAGACGTVLLVLLAGCGSGDDEAADAAADPSGSPVVRSDLAGKTFVSSSVTGQELVEGTKVRLDFDEVRLGVEAGCNSMAAAYDLEGGVLSWTETPVTTFKVCDDALTEQDNWLTSFFMDGVDTTTDGSTITMADDKGTTLVVTEKSKS